MTSKERPDVLVAPVRKEFEAYASAIGTLAQPEWVGDAADHDMEDRKEGRIVSIREARHLGNKIKIRTTYEISVNDEPFRGHAKVNDEGQVHCHAIPYESFSSAIEFVKRLIDLYPDTFQGPGEKGGRS